MTAEAIIAAARECLATPFKHQGRVLGVGMDCAGLLVHVLDSMGLPYVDERGYPRHPYQGLIKSILDDQPSLRPIPKADMAPGDVLLMRFRTEPQHVAIFTGSTMIHSYSGIGRVVEHSIDDVWRRRITNVYRIAGL